MNIARLAQVRNGTLRFDVDDCGPIDGEKIVLLHGFPQTKLVWEPVSACLEEEGFRTIAPTMRGYAPNARPRGRFAYRAAALAADVIALIDALGGQPVHLVGHDWGATAAWNTAILRPDLVTSLTTASVPHSAAFLRSMLSSNQLFRVYYMGLFQIPFLPEKIIRARPALLTTMLAHTGMREPDIEKVRTEILCGGAVTGSLNYYRAMMFNPVRLLRTKVSAPTTHVWGSADQALTRRSAELCANYVTGHYRLEILPDVSHWIPTEAPDDLAAIITARARTAANRPSTQNDRTKD